MRFIILAAALSLLSIPALTQPVFEAASNDRAMLTAMERARGTVQRVIDQLERGNLNASVKVSVRDGETVEHFWLRDAKYEKATGIFRGKIDNDPQMIKTVTIGQLVSAHRTAISDWLYMDVAGMRGNFTLRAALAKMEPAQAAQFRASLSEEP